MRKNSFLSVGLLTLISSAALLAAPPAPPASMLVAGTTTVVSTNAVSAPVGFFPTALIYSPTTILKPSTATMVQWAPNAEPTLAGYNFYFGDLVATNVFPKVTLPKTVTGAVMLGLNTNVVYGFYVTAFNTAAEESTPSTLVVLKPGTLLP